MKVKTILKYLILLIVVLLVIKSFRNRTNLEGFGEGHGAERHWDYNRGYYYGPRRSPYYGGYWGSDHYYYPRNVVISEPVNLNKSNYSNEDEGEDYPFYYYPYYYIKQLFS